ncbi:MAG: ribosome small subunit-dependent GTPase A [Peptococcaceae bacterium]
MFKIDMENLGLTERFRQEAQIYQDLYIGRVSAQYKDFYRVITETGELTAEVAGKFRYHTKTPAAYPAVGDFVMLDRLNDLKGKGIIHHVLARKSAFLRKAAGTGNDTQIIAANIDTIFICMSLNHDFNLRRLERYLSIAWDSGATPVAVLTKSDLCVDSRAKYEAVSALAIGVDVLVTTSTSAAGFLPLQSYLSRGKTVAFTGSSGVGKSTLINRLLGENVLDTNELRNDDKGRHTTTRRELIVLPAGGIVIDTPGMRELGIIKADLTRSFADIDDYAGNCKFPDCSHSGEPGCAVQKAVQDGFLTAERLASYRKLKKEAKYAALNAKQIEKEKVKEMFSGVGGMKNARKFIKEQNRKKNR